MTVQNSFCLIKFYIQFESKYTQVCVLKAVKKWLEEHELVEKHSAVQVNF